MFSHGVINIIWYICINHSKPHYNACFQYCNSCLVVDLLVPCFADMRFVAGAFCFTLAMVIVAAVETLSDDEGSLLTSPIRSDGGTLPSLCEVQGQAASSTSRVRSCEEQPQAASSSSGVKRKRSDRPSQTLSVHHLRSKVARAVQSVCSCSRCSRKVVRPSCFAKFAHVIDDVVKLRLKIHSLHKLDSDVFVSCPRRIVFGVCFKPPSTCLSP